MKPQKFLKVLGKIALVSYSVYISLGGLGAGTFINSWKSISPSFRLSISGGMATSHLKLNISDFSYFDLFSSF